MKIPSFLRVAILVLPLVLTSCGSHKKVQKPVVMNAETREKVDFISAVQENSQTAKFMTSKVKFSVEVGPQKLTLTGNLKMKRDDVIRLQLMAFGFVEAGRIEMTKDYVLIMDRHIQVDWQFLHGTPTTSHQQSIDCHWADTCYCWNLCPLS